MNFLRRTLLAVALVSGAFAHADDALVPLDPVSPPAAWKPIFAGLAKTRNIESTFTENRHMRLRKKPFELPGVMRYLPGVGVSLERLADPAEVVLVKPDGLYKRDDAGAFAKIPYDVAATRAPRVMLAVVAFEPEQVAKNFTIIGETHDNYWTLEMTPKSPDIASVVSKMRVTGFRDRLMTITLYDEDRIRLEIIITGVKFPEAFDAAAKKKYFGM